MNTLMEIIREHIRFRHQIPKLAKADLVKTYKGAALGWSWAVIRPAMTIAVYYYTFAVGLRAGRDVAGFPYFLWLLAGILPWFYMSGMFFSGAGVIRRYSYLVTKIRFPVSVIPSFYAISQLVVHLFLLLITMLIFIAMGYMPNIYWLQLPLYIGLMFLFFTVWTLFVAMVSAISKDFLQLVQSCNVALFWVSGIFYEAKDVQAAGLRTLMQLNPMSVIVSGFRNSFIYGQWFWEDPTDLRNFAIVFAVVVVLALWAYKKLIKSIADVL